MKPGNLASDTLEVRTRILGQWLLTQVKQDHGKRRSDWLDKLIAHAIEDQTLRVQVLRFIDVLPMLRDDGELVAHLQEYFGDQSQLLSIPRSWGLPHNDNRWAVYLVAPLVRKSLCSLSQRFMGGQTHRQVLRILSRLQSQGMVYTLDLLG